MPRQPPATATYRFQLTPTFGFDRVVAQLDRLADLGVSHVYLSPVTEAVPGSTHGYDVVDHARVRDELGGADGLVALLDACHGRGLGVIVDHVPNHTAVGRPELNPRWWALLRDGPDSAAGAWFDIDWVGGGLQVILPVLDAPLDEVVGRLAIADGELRLGAQRWPLAPGTEGMPVVEALERQHYRLQWWREPARNVRRFFTIDDLVGVRVEDRDVAAVVDTVPRQLASHPAFAGLRIDHIDGLADPQAYLDQVWTWLDDHWVVVEKILAPAETLPRGWVVDGTTGYEHAAVVEHALLDRRGWDTLRERWVASTGDARPFRDWEVEARREVLASGLRPDLDRAARAAMAAVEPVAELTVHLGRYRTYLPDEEGLAALDAALAAAAAARPDLSAALVRIGEALDEPGEWRTRWQQLTGPAMAKGVEDRAFWRYLPLASLAEVGGSVEPDPDADALAAVHDHHVQTAADWPTTLLAGTTHDTKRAEDVRAVGLALAARAGDFASLVAAWTAGPGSALDIDPAMQWLALQTVATTPGLDVERLQAFLLKAAREASTHTSWVDQDAAYEAQLPALAGAVLGWRPALELAAALQRPGAGISLAMLVVRLTAPGVPDIFQGTEAFRYVLVDPDNRAEPDHAALDELVGRAAAMDGRAAWREDGAPAARSVAIGRVLAARHRLELDGYVPIDAGPELLAFARTDPSGDPVLVTIVPRAGAGGTVQLPPGRWRHVLLDGEPDVEGSLAVAAPLAAFPAIVLTHP
jgi:(1->4)-alpha-D-glucan 1-alpha-D-glucosylmutase